MLAPLLFKVVMQTTTIDMLNYEVYMMVSLKGFMELYDILMIEFLHQHDLSTHRASTVLIDELGLIINLSSIVFVLACFIGESYYCVSALSEKPSRFVILVDFIRRSMSRLCRSR